MKQFQSAFTQKTQMLAEQRRALEALGSPEEIQQSLETLNQLSDPSNWAALHANLEAAMREQGMLPVDPAAPTPQTPGVDEVVDPELAPIVQQLKAQQAELAQLKAAREHEAMQMEAERQRQQMLGALQQQENEIVASNTNYEQDDLDMVYQLGSFFSEPGKTPDLLAAQARLEEYVGRRIAGYVAAKQAKSPTPGPAPKPQLNVREDGEPKSLKEIGLELEEHMRALQSAGELDD